MHAGMPILAPSDVQDVIDLGLLGFAMSRYTGLYTGFKLCNEILEQTMTVDVRSGDNGPVLPDRGPATAKGVQQSPTHPDPQHTDIAAKRHRRPLVAKFCRP